MNTIGRGLQKLLVGSRWLVAPFLVGLVVGLAALMLKFAIKLVDFVASVWTTPPAEMMVGILSLVDLTLTANLIVIVIFSSYENFVAPLDVGKNAAWPDGLTQIGFSDLKQKLLGSIVAIAAVSTLEWFVDLDRHADNVRLAWVVGIMLAFAVTMLILAIADRVSGTSHASDQKTTP